MANTQLTQQNSAELDDDIELTLAELCKVSQLSAEAILSFVEQGVVDPLGTERAEWRFKGFNVRRVRCVYRLQKDLGVNTAGAALAVELLDEIEKLRLRLRRFERTE